MKYKNQKLDLEINEIGARKNQEDQAFGHKKRPSLKNGSEQQNKYFAKPLF